MQARREKETVVMKMNEGVQIEGLYADDDEVVFTLDNIIENLKKEAASGTTLDRPKRLKLDQVEEIIELFQMRAMSERHINELARVIDSDGDTDPIVIFAVGRKYILLDGHHRLAAYRVKKISSIPVTYFDGTIEQAMRAAGEANALVKLPLSSQERADYAWRLVLLGGHSKAEIRKASGASPSSISTMRRAKKKLGNEAYEFDKWWKVRNKLTGIDDDQGLFDRDNWIEEQAQTYADRMLKAFSTKLHGNIEVAARELEIYFGRKLPGLLRELEGTEVIKDTRREQHDDDDF